MMFGALRYDSNTDDIQFVDHTYGFLDDRSSGSAQRSACDHCRSKKLRCSGQKQGCSRCKSDRVKCVYSSTTDDGRSKRRKQLAEPTAPSSRGSSRNNSAIGRSARPTQDAKQSSATELQRESSSELQFSPPGRKEDEVLDAKGHDPMAETFGYPCDFSDEDPFPLINCDQISTPKSLNEANFCSGSDTDFSNLFSSAPTTHMSDAWDLRLSPCIPPMSARMGREEFDDLGRHTPLSAHDMDLLHPDPSSGHVSESEQPPTPAFCGCLKLKVKMLEELGSQQNARGQLDDYLTSHKSYLARCRTALSCSSCMASSESVMLLVLIYERLVEFSSSMVDVCLKSNRRATSSSANSVSSEGRRLVLGRYQIDSDEELKGVLLALTIYQVNILGNQLLEMRKPASATLQRQQLAKLLVCERRMIMQMRRLKPEN